LDDARVASFARTSSNTESNLVDRTRSSQPDTTNESESAIPSRLNPCTANSLVRSDDGDAAPSDLPEAAVANTSLIASPQSRNETSSNAGSIPDPSNDAPGLSNERRGIDDPLSSIAASAPRSNCTSKHFRIRKITGRKSIDGDTYYVVAWKSSWVPSDLITTSEDGQERYIQIDNKNWRIAGTIKTKVKKGIQKDLVRWVDDTTEPIKRLRRALDAIRAFELKPRLDRRIVSFEESLFDRTKILPQSDKHFREAQVHCAEKWPMIPPRNDIDLTAALRQISLELWPPRDDDTGSRKTHQRLIDRPQVRRLYWGQEYVLNGRFYEFTPPKRNALLLQVVAEGAGDGHCARCVSDAAPFRECVRDTTEDNWLNGACANCGTAEANSTCCHHNVGTAHLERGRSKGLTSERLREFIDPTQSIKLFERLEYEDDDDSDTYSGDSYAESDDSAFWDPEASEDGRRASNDNDSDGQQDESTINNFWTPEARSEHESSSGQHHSATSSTIRSGGLFVSPHPLPHVAASPLTPDATHARNLTAVATGSGKVFLENAPRYTERRFHFDRSSVTLAAGSPASKLAYVNTTQDSGHDDKSGYSQMLGQDDMYDNLDSPFVQDSSSQEILGRDTASPGSIATSASRAAAMQSVETFGRNRPTYARGRNATSSDGSQWSSLGPKGRKRAASSPSEHEPATSRSDTGSSRSPRGAFEQSDISVTDPLAESLPAHVVAESSSTAIKIERDSVHHGCIANWPCRHPDHATPDDWTLVTVYRDTIDDTIQLSLGEVQYILSRCTCHWATAFTVVWDGWREEVGTSLDAELTKPQHLLSYFADRLLLAAQECCPTRPRNRDVIIID